MNVKMKILLVLFLALTLTTLSLAQEGGEKPKPVNKKVEISSPVPAAQNNRVPAEVVGNTEKIVKSAPFSAEAITESVQTLSDGNRIVRRTTAKMYRDSEGRFRREDMPQPNGNIGSMVQVSPTILIIDPVTKFRYFLYPASKTIRVNNLKIPDQEKIREKAKKIEEKTAEKAAERAAKTAERNKKMMEQADRKVKIETRKAEMAKEKTAIDAKKVEIAETARVKSETTKRVNEERRKIIEETRKETQKTIEEVRKESIKIAETTENGVTIRKEESTKSSSRINTTTESLGVKTIEGVEAEGTRSTKTIATGEIGNERPINIVYEKWYSKHLQMIVMSKHIDPRFGENTYRLTNIKLNEPDNSLFILPSDYKIINEKKPVKIEMKMPSMKTPLRISEPRVSKPSIDSPPSNSPKIPTVEKKPSPKIPAVEETPSP